MSEKLYHCEVRCYAEGQDPVMRACVLKADALSDARDAALAWAEDTAEFGPKWYGFTCMGVSSVQLPLEIPVAP